MVGLHCRKGIRIDRTDRDLIHNDVGNHVSALGDDAVNHIASFADGGVAGRGNGSSLVGTDGCDGIFFGVVLGKVRNDADVCLQIVDDKRLIGAEHLVTARPFLKMISIIGGGCQCDIIPCIIGGAACRVSGVLRRHRYADLILRPREISGKFTIAGDVGYRMLCIPGNYIVSLLPAVKAVPVVRIGLQSNGTAVADILAGRNGTGLVVIFTDGDVAVVLLKGCSHTHILRDRGNRVMRAGGNHLVVVFPADELVSVVRCGIDVTAAAVGDRAAAPHRTACRRICLYRYRVIAFCQRHIGRILHLRIQHRGRNHRKVPGAFLRIDHELSVSVNIGAAALVIADRPGNTQIRIVFPLDLCREAHGAALCHSSSIRIHRDTGNARLFLLNGHRHRQNDAAAAARIQVITCAERGIIGSGSQRSIHTYMELTGLPGFQMIAVRLFDPKGSVLISCHIPDQIDRRRTRIGQAERKVDLLGPFGDLAEAQNALVTGQTVLIRVLPAAVIRRVLCVIIEIIVVRIIRIRSTVVRIAVIRCAVIRAVAIGDVIIRSVSIRGVIIRGVTAYILICAAGIYAECLYASDT